MTTKKPRSAPSPARYSVRTEVEPGAKPVEVSIGSDLAQQTTSAKKYHQLTGNKTWLWRLRDGNVLLSLPRTNVAGGAK